RVAGRLLRVHRCRGRPAPCRAVGLRGLESDLERLLAQPTRCSRAARSLVQSPLRALWTVADLTVDSAPLRLSDACGNQRTAVSHAASSRARRNRPRLALLSKNLGLLQPLIFELEAVRGYALPDSERSLVLEPEARERDVSVPRGAHTFAEVFHAQ